MKYAAGARVVVIEGPDADPSNLQRIGISGGYKAQSGVEAGWVVGVLGHLQENAAMLAQPRFALE